MSELRINQEQLKALRRVAIELLQVKEHRTTRAPEVGVKFLNELGSDVLRVIDEVRGEQVFNTLAKAHGWKEAE